jgi:hypothetical protein
LFSGAQYVANIGRNTFGFETRAGKSFEHVLSSVLGQEIMTHILNQDADIFRSEELQDEDQGLAGDFSEEDILDIHREKKHEPHLGIVYRHPHRHHLNEAPNDLLSPYALVGEKPHHSVQNTHHKH